MSLRHRLPLLCALLVGLACLTASAARAGTNGLVPAGADPTPTVAPPAAALAPKQFVFAYTSHDGHHVHALVLLPAWYGAKRHPAIPLVIAPHGRGVTAAATAKLWGDLPTSGGFAVVIPDGYGRKLALYSWGYPGQIDDLIRMPALAVRLTPYLRVAPHRVYAVGGSMGAQEVLLMVARDPKLLAGVIAFDPATDMAARYAAFPQITDGIGDQAKARVEIGGTPAQVPAAYAARSPLTYAAQIAHAGVPIQLWWSVDDKIITDQTAESGRFYTEAMKANPGAPIVAYVGHWRHSAEMRYFDQLPVSLVQFGLLPPGVLLTSTYKRAAIVSAGTKLTGAQVATLVAKATPRVVVHGSRAWQNRALYGGIAAALLLLAAALATVRFARHARRARREVDAARDGWFDVPPPVRRWPGLRLPPLHRR